MSSKLNIAGIIIASILIIALLFVISSLKFDFFKFSPAAVAFSSVIQTPLEWYSTEYKTRIDWNTASSYCAGLPAKDGGTYSGKSWRLPTITELTQAHNKSSTSTPTNLQNWFYWSSTEVNISTTSTSTSAYDLDMTPDITSKVSIFNKDLPDDYAHCVRNATPPDVPTNISAEAGNEQAIVSFTSLPSDVIYPTTYTVISSSTKATVIASGLSSPITINGLTNGIPYTFTVIASNIAGTSTISSSSDMVTPQIPHAGGTYNPLGGRPACTSYTYSDWSSCVNNIKTRTFISSSPANCAGSTLLTLSCTTFPNDEWKGSDTPVGKTDWYTASSTCALLDKNVGQNLGVTWRLPSRDELSDKLGQSNSTPPSGFQNGYYWSGDTNYDSLNGSWTWVVDMTSGSVDSSAKIEQGYARCVRTKLEWSSEQVDINWSSSVSFCANLSENGTGWRLPTADELTGAFTDQFINSGSNPGGFQSGILYWSSEEGNLNDAWNIYYHDGILDGDFDGKGDNQGTAARCVR